MVLLTLCFICLVVIKEDQELGQRWLVLVVGCRRQRDESEVVVGLFVEV